MIPFIEHMGDLLWFHAFHRPTVHEVIDVLRRGPSFNPDPTRRTRKNEATLGLPPSVYAYLGKTIPSFGDVAFALPSNALSGEMAPFDTGGLVDHILPVRDADEVEKRAVLRTFSFATRTRRQHLSRYPGTTRDAVAAYLQGQRPRAFDGPHRVWPSNVRPAIAAIWVPSNSWRAWTWEGRVTKRLPTNGTVYRWSCTPALLQRIREYAEEAMGAEGRFLETLLTEHVPGGVSHLVRSLHAEQLP